MFFGVASQNKGEKEGKLSAFYMLRTTKSTHKDRIDG
jgi:hypothetical protein